MNDGWIKLHRRIWDNEFWGKDPFNRSTAWIDMLLLANYKKTHFFIRGNKIEVPRGSLCRSEESLATRWHWSRGKVRRFLLYLETEQQIVQHKNTIISVIEIKNYKIYQQSDTTNETTDSTTDSTTDGTHKKKVKKVKNSLEVTARSLKAFSPVVVSSEEIDLKRFTEAASNVLGCRKMASEKAKKQYWSRRKTYSHADLVKAIENVANEPDRWKLKNVAHRSLAWWLKSDEYIEELLSIHLKGNSRATIIP